MPVAETLENRGLSVADEVGRDLSKWGNWRVCGDSNPQPMRDPVARRDQRRRDGGRATGPGSTTPPASLAAGPIAAPRPTEPADITCSSTKSSLIRPKLHAYCKMRRA